MPSMRRTRISDFMAGKKLNTLFRVSLILYCTSSYLETLSLKDAYISDYVSAWGVSSIGLTKKKQKSIDINPKRVMMTK